ncbi:hypothetical protein BDQ17DRAFT_442295 [Cyathus striatus]|nr:hypothetical protein BDQ17DRAFT_442295 [Cyathus striatus]
MTQVVTLKALKLSEISSSDVILAEGDAIMKSTSSWKPGKVYFGNVQSYSRPKRPGDEAPWHCRVSKHAADEVTFDDLWDKLGRNKAKNEMGFIPEIKNVSLLKEISPTANIWSIYYEFIPPISPRIYAELQVVHLSETSPRVGTIVSIPIDIAPDKGTDEAKLEAKAIKARYVSVERLTELEDGKTEWAMCVSSSVEGSLPVRLIAEMSMDKEISKDVPYFMKWFKAL